MDAFLLAAARDEAVGEIFNLGGPPPVTLSRLAELLVEINEDGSFVVRAFPGERQKIDIEQSPGLASRFHVRGVPTLVVRRGDEQIVRHVGGLNRTRLAVILDDALDKAPDGAS